MNEIFSRLWENLLERTEGPMHLRFILQPLMSILFATLAAIRDAKSGQVPYLWRLTSAKYQRTKIVREAWKDVGKLLIMGFVLDTIYQLLVIYKFKTELAYYPLESIIVAFALAIVPYLVLRGPINRIVRIFVRPRITGEKDKA